MIIRITGVLLISFISIDLTWGQNKTNINKDSIKKCFYQSVSNSQRYIYVVRDTHINVGQKDTSTSINTVYTQRVKKNEGVIIKILDTIINKHVYCYIYSLPSGYRYTVGGHEIVDTDSIEKSLNRVYNQSLHRYTFKPLVLTEYVKHLFSDTIDNLVAPPKVEHVMRDGEPHFKLTRSRQPDNAKNVIYTETLMIREQDCLPVQYKEQYKMGETVFQKSRASISNFSTDTFSITKLLPCQYSDADISSQKFNTASKPPAHSKDNTVPVLTKGDKIDIGQIKKRDKGQLNLKEDTASLYLFEFWYTQCPPCLKTMPIIEKIHKRYPETVRVIGINPKDINKKTTRNILQEMGVSYENILVPQSTAQMFKINSYPTTYLTDENGRVLYVSTGYTPNFYNELKKAIENQID